MAVVILMMMMTHVVAFVDSDVDVFGLPLPTFIRMLLLQPARDFSFRVSGQEAHKCAVKGLA